MCGSHVKWRLVFCIELAQCWTLVLQILTSPELSGSKMAQLLSVFENFITLSDGNQVSSLRVNSLLGFLRVESRLCSL